MPGGLLSAKLLTLGRMSKLSSALDKSLTLEKTQIKIWFSAR